MARLFNQAQAATLFDFAQPFNVGLLESLVAMMYTSTNPLVRVWRVNSLHRVLIPVQDQKSASTTLAEFKAHEQAWTRCHQILSEASASETKVLSVDHQ